jgi:hypothetical protein
MVFRQDISPVTAWCLQIRRCIVYLASGVARSVGVAAEAYLPKPVTRGLTSPIKSRGNPLCRHTVGVNPLLRQSAIGTLAVRWIFLLKLPFFFQNRPRLAKRRRALLESNSPRNNQPETHQNRWSGERSSDRSSSANRSIGLIDLLLPKKTHRRSTGSVRGICGFLELLRRLVAERRVQAATIIVLLDEFPDVRA